MSTLIRCITQTYHSILYEITMNLSIPKQQRHFILRIQHSHCILIHSRVTLTFPCMNLKRWDYTAICKQLILNHVSNFTCFIKNPSLFQRSDSTLRSQITSSRKCKSGRKGEKTDVKNLTTITKGY